MNREAILWAVADYIPVEVFGLIPLTVGKVVAPPLLQSASLDYMIMQPDFFFFFMLYMFWLMIYVLY